jgi:hypothetical protein
MIATIRLTTEIPLRRDLLTIAREFIHRAVVGLTFPKLRFRSLY